MAEFTITKPLGEVKTLFNKIKEVYYIATANQLPSAISKADMELPVISDGVTFNTGEADVTKVKLTTGETWTSMATAGDSDITFQVGSFDESVNALMLNERGESVSMMSTIDGATYSGKGYDLEPKKLTGALLLCAQDKSLVIYLPNVEIYSSMVIEDGKPGYFNAKVTPLASTTGQALYILKKGA